MTPRPPGTARVMLLLAGVALRRLIHRSGLIGSMFSRGKVRAKPRKASSARFVFSAAMTVLVGALLSLQAIQFSARIIAAVASEVDRRYSDPSAPVISDHTYSDVAAAGNWLAVDEMSLRKDPAALRRRLNAYDAQLRRLFTAEAERAVLRPPRDPFGGPVETVREPSGDAQARIDALRDRYIELYKEKGLAGFRKRPSPLETLFPSPSIWPGTPAGAATFKAGENAIAVTRADAYGNVSGHSGRQHEVMLSAVGVLLTLLFAIVVTTGLGMANQNLAKVEWDMEWLFTFPVPSRALFLAKVFQYAVVNGWGWVVVAPFLLGVFIIGGYGWWAVPLALIAATCFNFLTGSAHMVIEVAIRTYLPMRRVKSVQALATVVGLVLLYAMLSLGFSPTCLKPIVATADALSGVVLWLPWSLPALANAGGASAAGGMAALVICAVAASLLASSAAGRLTGEGLIRESNVYSGTRGTAARKESLGFLKGIVGKDVKLLMRDRAFLVRVFVIPLCMVGFQLLINQHILSAGFSNFDHACAIAYGIGAFVLLSGAVYALSYEGKAIWLLFTFPYELEAILRRKAVFWWMISSIYAAAFLTYAATRTPLSFANAPGILMAMAGILPLSFLSVGLGAIATNPLSATNPQRLPVWVAWLFMLLASMYIPAIIYLPYAILQALAFVLWALLAFGVWLFIRSRLPRILDQA